MCRDVPQVGLEPRAAAARIRPLCMGCALYHLSYHCTPNKVYLQVMGRLDSFHTF